MVRPIDEPIPPEELLFLRLKPDELDGPHPRPALLDSRFPVSVSREKYMPNGVLDALPPPTKRHACCVLAARRSEIPTGLPYTPPRSTSAFQLVVVDDPQGKTDEYPVAIPAHALIGIVGVADGKLVRPPGVVRKHFESEFGDRFVACYRPTTALASIPPEAQRCPPPESSEWTTPHPGAYMAVPERRIASIVTVNEDGDIVPATVASTTPA